MIQNFVSSISSNLLFNSKLDDILISCSFSFNERVAMLGKAWNGFWIQRKLSALMMKYLPINSAKFVRCWEIETLTFSRKTSWFERRYSHKFPKHSCFPSRMRSFHRFIFSWSVRMVPWAWNMSLCSLVTKYLLHLSEKKYLPYMPTFE